MRYFRRIGLVCVLAFITFVSATTFNPLQSHRALAASVPNGLPNHFGIGLAAHPDGTGIYGWMPNSSIPWDYAYQYLSGGVNTGFGWETWNSSGQFALNYAQGAASHSYIPVFSYYELLQSNGSCNSCGEAQKDLSNLNNAATMASYFQNFTLLMKRLSSGTYDGISGFGQTAIVHVEPDLSGYAQEAVLNNGNCFGYCTSQGNNPSDLTAAVASSGVADVSAFPNTYQGFNWALLHLRDLYAPNVRLAIHVSGWATGQDIGSSTDPNLDVTALGQEVGAFAAQSGVTGVPPGSSTYDLLFNDVLDRDASYYKYVYNNPYVWWDKLNVTYPNFHRWESYVSAASQAAGRSVIVWQVPEGNQYFDSVNNSDGHYQDNRAEYFFSHISELAHSGVIGVLFGAGNGGSTVHYDGMNDGVTNPASFCTSDGVSSGQICNNHTSTVADDDGGYIRVEGQQYYASGGYPLGGGGGTSTPTPSSTTVPSTATATPTTPTATPSPGGIPLGLTSVGSTQDSGNAGYMNGSQIVVGPQSNTVTSMSVYVGAVDVAPRNQCSLAIYTDSGGSPGTLVAHSSTGTLTANSWNTLPVSAQLSANTAYWLMYNTNASSSSLNNMYYNPVPLGAYSTNGQTFGSWPGAFGSAATGNYQYSLYASVITGGGTSTPTPTTIPPTPTLTPVPPTPTATGVAPTPTSTPVPPTVTPTNVPPTATSTATKVPPTATPTRTMIPPTATPTVTPSGSLMIADFENSTNGFVGNSDITSMSPSTYAPAVAHGSYALWTKYSIPTSWSEAQLFKTVNLNLGSYSTLSVSVYPKRSTGLTRTGVKVRFLVQGSDNSWYSSLYQSVPLDTRTTVRWNMGGVPRSPLKQLYVCWQFTTSATSTGSQMWMDDIQAS